jgi:2-polyprenyl-3-methyl-5-hydroxy-6-metoxy-1,4-benzoquinol methylase
MHGRYLQQYLKTCEMKITYNSIHTLSPLYFLTGFSIFLILQVLDVGCGIGGPLIEIARFM